MRVHAYRYDVSATITQPGQPKRTLNYNYTGHRTIEVVWRLYTPTDMHSLVHALMHALMHTLVHALMHTLIHALVHALMHTLIHALMHTLIHALMHTLIHMHSHPQY